MVVGYGVFFVSGATLMLVFAVMGLTGRLR